MAEFVVPDFLLGQSPEEIHQEMIEQLPVDIDVSEGSIPYDNTFPTAYVLSMLIQFRFTEMLKMITPQYCEGYDDMAEYHGETRNIIRKSAVSAIGTLDITANEGTVIPKGSIFSTVSANGTPAVEFQTTEAVSFDTDSTITVNIEAVTPGIDGNVPENTIILKVSDISGITAINNSSPTTNGMEQESLTDYINRIVEFDQSQGQSYIGNPADYKRWAEEVEKVGHADVILPASDDDLITIIITDLNGEPAAQSICADVYNHIMSPTPPSTTGQETEGETTSLERLAPINAHIQVISPAVSSITLSAHIKIDAEKTTLAIVQSALYTAVKEYCKTATDYIYLSQIGSLITDINGVIDYDMDQLLLNNTSENIAIPPNTRLTINETDITLTSY